MASTVVDLPTAGGTVRILDVRGDAPVASVISLSGGSGFIGILNDGTLSTPQGRCGPVSRNRDAFAQHGYALALVDDAASASVQNMSALIAYLRGKADVPVWIVGGSSATSIVADLAVNLSASLPIGAVFWSPDVISAATAAKVQRPSFVLWHSADPTQAGALLYDNLTAAPVKQRTALTGGTNAVCATAGFHVFNGLDAQFVGAVAGFIDANNAGLANGTLVLNQHGLGGSWYEPSTAGQGFELEVFPDLVMPGTGFAQMSWFTYDTVAGGADRQRWYTLSGPVSGAVPAALTIYRNAGGNFDAPPATSATAVGNASLSFDTCASGFLAYNFTDGSGRTGVIQLSRLLQNVTCSMTSARPTHPDFAMSGNWYDPATSGQGITVEVNPASSFLFLAWYTYAPNGAASGIAGQRWYTGQGAYASGARAVAFPLYETTGGQFDAPTPTATMGVGTATLTFQSCTSAALSFTFTGGSSSGRSGAINLVRVGPAPPGCA